MKKRLLISFLCATLCTSMIAEAGAAAFTDQPVAVAEETTAAETAIFTDVAVTVESQQPVEETTEAVVETPVEETVPEEVPVTEDVPAVEEVPGTEDIPAVEEVPGTEDVPVVEEVPGTEEIPIIEEVSGSEEEVVVPGTEEVPETEESEIPVDIFTSEAVEGEDVFVSVEVESTDIVNQEGIVYEVNDWRTDENGWKLVKAETSIPQEPNADGTVNDAVEIKEEFFTLTDGIVRIITKQDDTTVLADGYYLFNADGYLVTGQYMMQPGTAGYIYETANEYLYMDAAFATLNTGIAEGTAKTPYNSNLGQLQRNYWFWNGTAFRYYDNSGKFNSVEELKASAVQNNTYVGYYQINGVNYALNADGTPVTGMVKISEGNKPGYYCFSSEANANGIPGQMVINQWVPNSKKTRWRYYGSDGLKISHNHMVTNLDGQLGDYQYLLDRKGNLVKSAPKIVGDACYYANKYGRIVKNKIVTYKGRRYYYTADGTRATYTNGWYRVPCANNRYYYFGKKEGLIIEKRGFERIDGDWYYFNSKGNHYTNYWSSKGRYFNADGTMCSGVCTVNGVKYFFVPSTASKANGLVRKNRMFKAGGVYYYSTANGALLEEGWIKNSGYYYYFKGYKRQSNTFAKLNGVNGYLNSTGKYTTGWVIFNDSKNLVKYVNPTGSDFYKNTTAWIDGLQYRFDADGYRVNDRTSEISGPYYVEADVVNCVMTIYNSAKTIPVKSIRISPGAASTPTPRGTFKLNRLGRWWTLMGPSYGQYCTHVVGAGQGGIIVHSVPTGSMSVYSFSPNAYKKLGQPASHGCIRCCVADSKWVYDYCQGATIRIFGGNYKSNEVFKGPLGRRPIVPATGNFDPTDPAIVG